MKIYNVLHTIKTPKPNEMYSADIIATFDNEDAAKQCMFENSMYEFGNVEWLRSRNAKTTTGKRKWSASCDDGFESIEVVEEYVRSDWDNHRYVMGYSQEEHGEMVVYAHDIIEAQMMFEAGDFKIEQEIDEQ